jgi:hypothetical protein
MQKSVEGILGQAVGEASEALQLRPRQHAGFMRSRPPPQRRCPNERSASTYPDHPGAMGKMEARTAYVGGCRSAYWQHRASWSQGRMIGSTVIVVNTVEGTLASGSAVPVVQGDAVYRDEGVRTRVDSKAGFLMEDKTNVSVGPSSTLKLDRFVYAGPANEGTIILNLARGTCRLVIGDANKRSYTILTPTAAIGIRS